MSMSYQETTNGTSNGTAAQSATFTREEITDFVKAATPVFGGENDPVWMAPAYLLKLSTGHQVRKDKADQIILAFKSLLTALNREELPNATVRWVLDNVEEKLAVRWKIQNLDKDQKTAPNYVTKVKKLLEAYLARSADHAFNAEKYFASRAPSSENESVPRSKSKPTPLVISSSTTTPATTLQIPLSGENGGSANVVLPFEPNKLTIEHITQIVGALATHMQPFEMSEVVKVVGCLAFRANKFDYTKTLPEQLFAKPTGG